MAPVHREVRHASSLATRRHLVFDDRVRTTAGAESTHAAGDRQAAASADGASDPGDQRHGDDS
jgi:GrpB-like predicted nucleotidyltransferase (UPF0157 family)